MSPCLRGWWVFSQCSSIVLRLDLFQPPLPNPPTFWVHETKNYTPQFAPLQRLSPSLSVTMCFIIWGIVLSPNLLSLPLPPPTYILPTVFFFCFTLWSLIRCRKKDIEEGEGWHLTASNSSGHTWEGWIWVVFDIERQRVRQNDGSNIYLGLHRKERPSNVECLMLNGTSL